MTSEPAGTAGEAAGPVQQVGPLGVELTPTGHPVVDAGLVRLEALDGVPAEAHVAVYEDVHQRLADTLAALDQE
ncbi:hypothetical protein [Streptomyces rubellomurinus]|uniref:hypothetical protein n=1 Tax=Streptomyces rubellomurinus (strain ATCC 31215) TaxID=359131 RepID=UPI001FC97AE6|nr:hypothetical protein [Streptomyces rubellomurinus]